MNRITQYYPDNEVSSLEDAGEAKLFAFDGRDVNPDVLHDGPPRHVDPRRGWLNDAPLGCETGDDNLQPYPSGMSTLPPGQLP